MRLCDRGDLIMWRSAAHLHHSNVAISSLSCKPGVWNLFTMRGRINCRWRAANKTWFYHTILPSSYNEERRLLKTSCLKCLLIMELRFDAILYSTVNWVTKILMRAAGFPPLLWTLPFQSRVRHFFAILKSLQLNKSPGDWARELFIVQALYG